MISLLVAETASSGRKKPMCSHEEDTKLLFLCVCMGDKGCCVGRREAVRAFMTGMGCDSVTPASIHSVWELPKAEQIEAKKKKNPTQATKLN